MSLLVDATKICKHEGRDTFEFFRLDSTKHLLDTISDQLDKPVADLLVTSKGRVGRTLVHPEIAKHLRAWCKRKRVKRAEGYVYTATSPVLAAVKIGRWRGSIHNLKARYRTSYGPGVEIRVFATAQPAMLESITHKAFEHLCLGGELFQKEHYHRYHEFLRCNGGASAASNIGGGGEPAVASPRSPAAPEDAEGIGEAVRSFISENMEFGEDCDKRRGETFRFSCKLAWTHFCQNQSHGCHLSDFKRLVVAHFPSVHVKKHSHAEARPGQGKQRSVSDHFVGMRPISPLPTELQRAVEEFVRTDMLQNAGKCETISKTAAAFKRKTNAWTSHAFNQEMLRLGYAQCKDTKKGETAWVGLCLA